MHLIDVERLKYMNSPEYYGSELCSKLLDNYQARIMRERLSVYGDVIENYLPILADETSWPLFVGNPKFMSDRWHWKIPVKVKTRHNNGIVDAYFNTILSMNEDDFVDFVMAAKKSVSKGRIVCHDRVFITSPIIEDCQKRIDDFQKIYE